MEDTILVCMPTFHSPIEWISRAVNSLKIQTYNNFECWVVKDGCDKSMGIFKCQDCKTCINCFDCKKTKKFFKQVCSEDKRFKYCELPINFNKCGWGPRNFALLNTEHNYVAYLDDDNWYESDHLEVCYDTIIKNNYDFCLTGRNYYNFNNEKVGQAVSDSLDTSAIMHKKHLIVKYGGWVATEYNDVEIVTKWKNNNVSWGNTHKITLNYFYRETGVTSERKVKNEILM